MAEELGIVISLITAGLGTLWIALRVSIKHLYADLKEDRDRVITRLDKNTEELMAAREERAACRASLDHLRSVIEGRYGKPEN